MDDTRGPGARPLDPEYVFGGDGASAGEILNMDILPCGEAVLVVVSGEIDVVTADRLNATLTAAADEGPKILVVDLEKVQFFGSTGLTALALTQRAARERGVELRVVATSRSTLLPLRITGMMDSLAVYASRAEALAGCFGEEPSSDPSPTTR